MEKEEMDPVVKWFQKYRDWLKETRRKNNQPDFWCPFAECKSKSKHWLSVSSLVQHLEQVHVRSGRPPPQDFLHSIGRKLCNTCQALHPHNFVCFRDQQMDDQPQIPVMNEPLSGEAVINEIKQFGNCLHHVPHGCVELVGGLMTDLLQRAADTGRLSDVRALYIAPRVILAPLQRGGIKHDQQMKAVIRDRIAQWPNLPQPEPQPHRKRRVKQRQETPQSKISQQKESVVEQAIRDKALSKACKLLVADEILHRNPDHSMEYYLLISHVKSILCVVQHNYILS